MIVEEHIQSIGATVALSKEGGGSRIAFQRDPHHPVLVDYQESITAVWDKKCVVIQGTEYASNTWHALAEDSPIKNYFKAVISKHLENIMVYNEQTQSWRQQCRM